MKLIICVDKNNGMMFNNRRLSKDYIVCNKIVNIVNYYKAKLYMNEYSFNIFKDYTEIIVDNNFLNIAEINDFCFVENNEVDISKVNEIYIFNWNRDYPADFYFNYDLNKNGFIKAYSENFIGNSHDNILLEIFKRG